MFFAALLGVSLVPVLMLLFVRGKITPEAKNPINRFLIWLTSHLFISCCASAGSHSSSRCSSWCDGLSLHPPWQGIHAATHEGDILFMPTAVPGMTVGEATKVLQIQDRMLRQFPEVDRFWQGRPVGDPN